MTATTTATHTTTGVTNPISKYFLTTDFINFKADSNGEKVICLRELMITGSEARKLSRDGRYAAINKRRKWPVWYNAKNNVYLFASSNDSWIISSPQNYKIDGNSTNTYTPVKGDCPTNRDFYINVDGEWKRSTDFLVKPAQGKEFFYEVYSDFLLNFRVSNIEFKNSWIRL